MREGQATFNSSSKHGTQISRRRLSCGDVAFPQIKDFDTDVPSFYFFLILPQLQFEVLL